MAVSYQDILNSLAEATGASSRQLIVDALNYANENGTNASGMIYRGTTYDGSTFALVDGTSEDPGLREYFGNELITRRPQ